MSRVSLRVGIGYDIHKLVKDRKLFLGGVLIPYEMGLLGHSDADVLIHAIIRAITGAVNLPDIGQLFPDTDPAFKDAPGVRLLAAVRELLTENGWYIVNIDSTIIAQRPKLFPYYSAMSQTMAGALNLSPHIIGVKAATNEGLGYIGQGQAIAAQAVALLGKD